MNPLEGLANYLDRLERRLRLFAWTKGAAAVAGTALALTLVIVGVLLAVAFTPNSLLAGRFLLFLGIGAAIALALVSPLLRLNRRKAAQEIEQRRPGFDQRLVTFTERVKTNADDPFLPLLAEDTLAMARDAEPEQVIESGRIFKFAGAAAVAAGVLLWLMFSGPGAMGHGTSLLWGTYPKDISKPFFTMTVEPGSKTIRRKADLAINATLNGYTATRASLWAKFASSTKWEEAPMQPVNGGAGFGYMFVSVPEDVEYYVEAGGVKSAAFKVRVVDLPAVKNVKVTLNYPSWTGLGPETEDPGGDLRAVEGTVAHLEIETDKALSGGQIVFEEGKPIDLDATKNNRTNATINIAKDGTYHIAVMDHGESVRLSDDYFIEARKPGQPSIHVNRPGKDAKVSPIEEVTVNVTAEDDYPLQEVNLHYSVNGGAEKVVPLLKQKGAKKIDSSTLISLEDFKLIPGDLVSLFATVKDGKNTAETDMFFIQAVPFEFNYSQSQQAGGGGGGGGMDQQEQQISDREKEIIAATFNQIKGDPKTKLAAAENGKYLSDVQAKLRDQAQSLANRSKARQLDGSGAGFGQFVKEMEAAVASMSPASEKLKGLGFQEALAPEQQALQHLLRAEATFRDIQIQVSRGGGGGGGGGGAGRDLANLFDLELDKEKNQYETNASSQQEAKQQAIDEAMKKLEELSRRQQALAQQPQTPQQLAQQRWEQEMLRREAEQLKRQMEQLQRGENPQQSQNGQQGQQGQSGQQGQQSQQSGQQSASGQQSGQQQGGGQQQNGQQQQNARNQQGQQQNGQQQQSQAQRGMDRLQRAQAQQLENAIKQLDQAEREMGNSASGRQQQGGQGQSEAQAAAERLKQAEQMLQSMRNQQNGNEMTDLANRAAALAGKQQDFEQKLRKNFGAGRASQQVAQQLADEKHELLGEYNQMQKDMQQAVRNSSSTAPDVSRRLRNAMGKSQQDEVQSKMEQNENFLRQGLGQYAVMREAPVTKSLNDLKDELRKLEDAASSAANGKPGDDNRSGMATQQALDKAESIRRQMEQLARAQDGQRGRNGQSGQQGGQQQGGQQPGGQQPGGQQGGQQQASGGQQGAGQQQGGAQQGGSPQGGGQRGGGDGVNRAGAYNGGNLRGGNLRGGNATWGLEGAMPAPGNRDAEARAQNNFNGDPGQGLQTPAQAQQAYADMMRDIARLRANIQDDKDLAREYQDLVRKAQELDPKHWNNDPELAQRVGAAAVSSVDQVELMLRRKMDSTDGSVRSANPRLVPPGYDAAVAEYNKRLSKQ